MGATGEMKNRTAVAELTSLVCARMMLLRCCRSDIDEGLTPTKDGGTCLRRLSMFRKEVH